MRPWARGAPDFLPRLIKRLHLLLATDQLGRRILDDAVDVDTAPCLVRVGSVGVFSAKLRELRFHLLDILLYLELRRRIDCFGFIGLQKIKFLF